MKKLMRWSAVLGGGFLVAALGIVFYLGTGRMMVIAESGNVSDLTESLGIEEQQGYLPADLKTSERFEKAVVLDAEGSDALNDQEKEALYQIEEKCRAILEAEGIKVYDVSRKDIENKLIMIEQTKTAMYLGLMLDKDEDPESFGSYVCYNSLYFRPWLTNGSFADRMEQEMVTAIEGRALGLMEIEEGILPQLSIPAVIICPGYVSHEKEGKLLLTEAYQERVAEGICRGILETFEDLKGQGLQG